MTDQQVVILTVIGDDRPGLVGELSGTISAHRGNWLRSSLAHLSGKFAGIVEVAISTSQTEALRSALAGLSALKIGIESADRKSAVAERHLRLSLVGHDRVGIVRELTQALASHGANVERLTTHTETAPMSAEILFYAEIDLTAKRDFDARALKGDLERVSNDLMVDINLDEKIA